MKLCKIVFTESEEKTGFKHDQMAALLSSFDLFYDPSYDDSDISEICHIAHETMALQSC